VAVAVAAVLALPDGRVLLAGGDRPAKEDKAILVFVP
jgi:hypothetical protein